MLQREHEKSDMSNASVSKRGSNSEEGVEWYDTLTRRGANLVIEQVKLSKRYAASVHSHNVWSVAKSDHTMDEFLHNAVAIPRRPVKTRYVRLEDGVFLCSCNLWEQQGLPCRHVMAVMKVLSDLAHI